MHPEMTLALAFLAGLGGAGHCWAMCGGLVGAAFLCSACRACAPGLAAHAGYHLGRVLAYTLLGALAAAIGQAIVLAGGVGRAQGALYVAAGILVVLAGLWVAGAADLFRRRRTAVGAPPIVSSPRWRKAWPAAGFFNGLMPCALVFSLTAQAATAPSVVQGAAWLLAFGLGTLPAMALAGALAGWLGRQSLIWLRRLAGLLVVALGVQTIWAGARFFHVMLHL
ncbi:MAG: sulfite exporter TauE/SafE family protein [Betaproteobacteria bacterium]|nr:sulfite exporter TauE/SafE family protein [Betaproteobacteria bacterium]